jgi:hypothetical protein
LTRLLPLVLLAACGPPGPSCPAGFVGDPALPPEGALIYTNGRDGVIIEHRDGSPIPLEPPPQGGYVMYIAARVRNMNGCGIEFRGRLLNPDNGVEIGFDARSANLVVGADGWGRPDPQNNANLSNVNGCPDYTPRDVHALPHTLELTVVDRDRRTLTLRHTIVPTCMLSDPYWQNDCVCTCQANYFLGKCNAAFDAGTD